MNKILVATDGSEGGDRAVDFAARMAAAQGAGLVIVNVVGANLPGDILGQVSQAQNAWIHEVLASHSAGALREARDRARGIGAADIQLESRDGDPAQAILDLAEDVAAEAIVVGKRGAGRVAGLLLGSVSQKLVSLANRAVVVVP
jgi:nucleotide-binding universal stress UspA family protein